MTATQRLRAARAFWLDEQAAADHMQAVMLISQQRKFRPKSVVALDVERKAKHLATVVRLPDLLAARALVAHHLADQRPMMSAFLDALGVAHDDGLIKDDAAKPALDLVRQAASTIGERFPADDVSLYLNTLLCQDPETWGGLSDVPQRLDPVTS